MTLQVKYLSEAEIERDAEALLAEYAVTRKVTLAPPIPIEDIVEKYLKLLIEFDDLHRRLGAPQLGPEPEIFGALWVDRRTICIDRHLDPDEHPDIEGRFRFTLGHEGGHWSLHRNYLFSNTTQGTLLPGRSSAPAVICRSNQAKERVEWQADCYASCLLMPRGMVIEAWRNVFGATTPIIYEQVRESPAAKRPLWRGPRELRHILVELLEPEHTYLFDQVARGFAPTFGVSVQAMRIRLEKLGLLLTEAPSRLEFDVRT